MLHSRDYSHFSSADFLTDDAFVAHRLTPTQASISFWTQWELQQAHDLEAYLEAITLLESIQEGLLDYARTRLSEETIAALWVQIQASNAIFDSKTVTLPIFSKWPLWMAACLAVILATFVYYQFHQEGISPYETHIAALNTAGVERRSELDTLTLRLPDGSTVTLAPNSRITYPADFNNASRSVYLSGEAQFEVVKNPQKPFLVMANHIITKVLGTQFKVRAYDHEEQVQVQVVSGQVSVYRDLNPDGMQAQQKGLLLLPNQQALFSRKDEAYTKSLVDQPHVIRKETAYDFTYDEVSIVQVFSDFEKAYGIPIRYHYELLKDCQVSASLNVETFDQKMAILCKIIDASYQKIDGQVLVIGGHCR